MVEPELKLKNGEELVKSLEALGFKVELRVLWEVTMGYHERLMATKEIGSYTILVDCVPAHGKITNTCYITAAPTTAPEIHTQTPPEPSDVTSMLLKVERDARKYDKMLKSFVCKTKC